VAATIGAAVADPEALWRREAARRRREAVADGPGLRGALRRAARRFLFVAPGPRTAAVASFPGARVFGEEAFAALPGLTIARDAVEECGAALAAARPWIRDGLLPEEFGAAPGEGRWGGPMPSLWFARAVLLYDEAGGARRVLRGDLLPALADVASGLAAACDADGLLGGGGPPPVFRVDANALWWSLLDHLAALSRFAGKRNHAARWAELRRRAGRAFLERFWLEEEGRLADAWSDGTPDRRVRPGMVVAASLARSPLTRARRARVVAAARADLLTPRGLRALSPRDEGYRPRCGPGEIAAGAALPWLLGPYAEACLRAEGGRSTARDHVRALLEGLATALGESGLGHLPEAFDGEPPQRPAGAFADARGAAEVLRALALPGIVAG